MMASAKGRIGTLKILLQSKPNAELKDENGCTATDHAIINNNNKLSALYCVLSCVAIVNMLLAALFN